MRDFDVFNGDADGLCALTQLGLVEPRDATPVTGVKRDITLLEKVAAGPGDRITALDISLDSNRAGLMKLLEAGAEVDYFDHHFAGDIPASPRLRARIDTAPTLCTSLIVDRHLEGAQRLWAITGAFGDNLLESARDLAAGHGLSADATEQLLQLGQGLNYNAYGETLADLRYAPADLSLLLREAGDPFTFIASGEHFRVLKDGLAEDLALARELSPLSAHGGAAAWLLPDTPWARRVSGLFANELAIAHPQRAHAILTHRSEGGYAVSVRAPVAHPAGADALCRRFPSGGGRSGAAGINALPGDQLDAFLAAMAAQYPTERH